MTQVQKVHNTTQKVQVDVITGIANLNHHILHQLTLLNQPINSSKDSQATIKENLYKLLEDQLDLVLLGLKNKGIVNDPVGILENKHILANRKELKSSTILPLLIKRLLKDKEDTIMARQTAKQKADAANKANATNTNPETSTPVIKVPTPKDESVVATDTAVILDFNIEFHQPYVLKVEDLLKDMNDKVEEDPEFIKLKTQMQDVIRNWVNAYYKNIMQSAEQVEGVTYITKDTYGILEGDHPFTSPDYFDYDYVHLVSEMFTISRKKFQNANNQEVSVETGCKAILDLQDESKPIVNIDTNTEAKESIQVNKETGDVEVKKDNIVVRCGKAVYNGFLNFCSNIKNLWFRFWNWCKSWFSKEEKVIISKEEYEALSDNKA